jgi:hypothetical protein
MPLDMVLPPRFRQSRATCMCWVELRIANGQTSDVFVSRSFGVQWQRGNASSANWSARYFLSASFLGSDLFVFGGTSNGIAGMSDCWRCAGGTCNAWTRATQVAASARHSSVMIDFQNQLTVIGGLNGGLSFADVWQSPDGTNWTRIVSSAAFAPRYGHSVVRQRNKLYLMGGSTGTNQYSAELWSSTDAGNSHAPPHPFAASTLG